MAWILRGLRGHETTAGKWSAQYGFPAAIFAGAPQTNKELVWRPTTQEQSLTRGAVLGSAWTRAEAAALAAALSRW